MLWKTDQFAPLFGQDGGKSITDFYGVFYDRIYHRFLWRNGNIRQPPNNYQ